MTILVAGDDDKRLKLMPVPNRFALLYKKQDTYGFSFSYFQNYYYHNEESKPIQRLTQFAKPTVNRRNIRFIFLPQADQEIQAMFRRKVNL